MHLLDIYIISDSMGETGALVAKSAISQFKTQDYRIKRFPYVHKLGDLKPVLEKASLKKENTIIVYTLVDTKLAQYVKNFTRESGILSIDLMNPIIDALEEKLDDKASRELGVARKLNDNYFSRVNAIEFAVKYDDGKDPEGFRQAEIVLVGVSRTSKTPLSMYLANKNIKVANLPLVLEVSPPPVLFEIPATKIIGLTNTPDKLNEIREERLKSLGVRSGSSYADFERILDELEHADQIMRRIGCPVIDVSNRAIEETADIVLELAEKNAIHLNLY